MQKVLQKEAHRSFLESVKPVVRTYLEAALLIEKKVQLHCQKNSNHELFEWTLNRTICKRKCGYSCGIDNNVQMHFSNFATSTRVSPR